MTSEICVQIRQKYEKIVACARMTAKQEIDADISKLERDRQSPEQVVLWLHEKLLSIEKEIEDFEPGEYFWLANDEKFLMRLYSSRIFCNNSDEAAALGKGVLFNEKYKMLCHHHAKAMDQIAPVSLTSYLENNPTKAGSELSDGLFCIPEIDFNPIGQWQTAQKEACGSAGFTCLKAILLKACHKDNHPEKVLKAELEQLKHIFHQSANWQQNRFVKELFKLQGLSGLSLSGDITAIYEAGMHFLHGRKMDGILSPLFFQTTIKDLECGHMFSFPLLGFSLNMYYRWLEDKLSGKVSSEEFPSINLYEIFDGTYFDGVLSSEPVIESFERKSKRLEAMEHENESEILTEMDKMWEQYNHLQFPHYFHHLEHFEKLRSLFIEDCLSSIHIEQQQKELKMVIIMFEMIVFLNEKMSIVKHNPLAPLCHPVYEFYQFSELLGLMNPDSALLKHYIKEFKRIKNSCRTESIPLYFISKDMGKAVAGLFNKAIKHLKHSLERMSVDDRGFFINYQLRELMYMDIGSQGNQPIANPYKEQLMRVFTQELELIHGMKAFKAPEINAYMETNDPEVATLFSFGYHTGPFDLKAIFKALQIQINLFKDGNVVDEFWEAFTSNDLSKHKKPFVLGCQTNQFKGVMDLCGDYATNFNPASIERSGLFISKKGKPITANCLSASNTEGMRRGRAIINIFQNKQ